MAGQAAVAGQAGQEGDGEVVVSGQVQVDCEY